MDPGAFPSSPADAVPWITVAQMRDVDRVAIELGVTLPRMMENAGAHLATVALSLLGNDLFIDSVLGYSQRGTPRGGAGELIAGASGAPVLSLDVPSGLVLEDGTVYEPAVRADATVTLALPKAGLRRDGTSTVVGRLYLADIGIPPHVYSRLGIVYRSPFAHGAILHLR